MTVLVIDQHVDADIARVWRAWTTRAGLATWWWPQLADPTYSIDASPGGSYRIESPAAGIGVTGEYVVLDEPHLIVMTWRWLGDTEEPTEQVRVELRESGPDATSVTVTHEVQGGQEAADANRTGWVDVLTRLGRLGQSATTG